MRLLRKTALSCTALLLSTSLFAIDWGGKLTNDTSFIGLKDSSLKPKQTDTLSLWTTIPLSKDNSRYFAAEGNYQFKYDGTDTAADEITNTLDLNLFKFAINKKLPRQKNLSFTAGRFGISDLTGTVFAQNCDGLLFQFSMPRFSTNLYAGYTGLLNANSVTILNGDESSYELADPAVYRLAPKYVPFGINFTFPGLFANQNLSLQGWGFADANGDGYNRYYGLLSLDGYLVSNLYYTLKTVMGSENFEGVSNLSILNLYCYFTETFFMNLAGTYASGEQGDIKAFKGVTSMPALISSDDPEYTSLIKADLNFTKTFGKVAYINGGAACAFSIVDESPEYKGLQIQASAMYKVFNDVQLGASFGQFIGKESDLNKTHIAVKAAVVF